MRLACIYLPLCEDHTILIPVVIKNQITGVMFELRKYESSSFVLFCLSLFIYFERESERAHVHNQRRGREVEGQRERSPCRFHSARTEPDAGLNLTNREIMT